MLHPTTVTAVVMLQEFLRGEPIFQLHTRSTTAFHPKMVCGFLNFGLGRLVGNGDMRGFFHGRRGFTERL